MSTLVNMLIKIARPVIRDPKLTSCSAQDDEPSPVVLDKTTHFESFLRFRYPSSSDCSLILFPTQIRTIEKPARARLHRSRNRRQVVLLKKQISKQETSDRTRSEQCCAVVDMNEGYRQTGWRAGTALPRSEGKSRWRNQRGKDV